MRSSTAIKNRARFCLFFASSCVMRPAFSGAIKCDNWPDWRLVARIDWRNSIGQSRAFSLSIFSRFIFILLPCCYTRRHARTQSSYPLAAQSGHFFPLCQRFEIKKKREAHRRAHRIDGPFICIRPNAAIKQRATATPRYRALATGARSERIVNIAI